MERIRRSLGEDQISFLGFSYGTLLGALYAAVYPDRARAMVLDGAVDPTLSSMESATQQAEGLERGLEEFFADCSRDDECAIHDDPSGIYTDVMASIEAAPMRVRANGEERLVTPAQADIAVAAALYSQSSWSDLARALASAKQGNGRELVDLFDGYMARDSDGSYSDEWPGVPRHQLPRRAESRRSGCVPRGGGRRRGRRDLASVRRTSASACPAGTGRFRPPRRSRRCRHRPPRRSW